LVLANGSRLALASASCADGHTLECKTLFDAAVKVTIDQVVALDLRLGRAVYLSDLKPRAYEHVSYLGLAWPYVADGSVAGGDLRLSSGTYDKGLGLHSQSRITYDLAGEYQYFEALVGFDESGRSQDGSVRIKVLVDGKAQDLGFSSELTAQAGPRPVRVKLVGARALTLLVEFGRRGDVNGRIDWADARMIK
jgi:hypothetical protein